MKIDSFFPNSHDSAVDNLIEKILTTPQTQESVSSGLTALGRIGAGKELSEIVNICMSTIRSHHSNDPIATLAPYNRNPDQASSGFPPSGEASNPTPYISGIRPSALRPAVSFATSPTPSAEPESLPLGPSPIHSVFEPPVRPTPPHIFAPPSQPPSTFVPLIQPPSRLERPPGRIPKEEEPEYSEQYGNRTQVFVETTTSSALMRRASADPDSPPYSHNSPSNPRRTEKTFRMNNENHLFAYYQSTSRSSLEIPLVGGAVPGDLYFHYNSHAHDSQFNKTGQMWQCQVDHSWKETTREYLRTYPEIAHPTRKDRVVYFSPGDKGEPSYVTMSWWGSCVKKDIAYKGRPRSASLGQIPGTPFSSASHSGT